MKALPIDYQTYGYLSWTAGIVDDIDGLVANVALVDAHAPESKQAGGATEHAEILAMVRKDDIDALHHAPLTEGSDTDGFPLKITTIGMLTYR